ncbi:MAG TPA: polysaccharide deacetylase family protein [Solirubrobacteraceae bacterium]|jgi:peptidoglycan/xylan/chitin deacetylase (PgdA/CDA1 family)|nr:polysaccharide deacetylase family protein [Solirubrobacteraceae bacterium]
MTTLRPAVTMTFDDGPDPVWTPRVLRELADVRATATFFVITTRAAAHPHLIDAIRAAGHEIGLHCARHLRHTQTPRTVIEDDTAEALQTLSRLGQRPTRWRVPWGACADWTHLVAADHGLSITGWTADTHDWRGDPAAAMLDSVADDLSDQAIVLMHDGLGPGALRDGCRETVRLISPLVTAIRERGCEPVSLAEIRESSQPN